MRTTFKLSQPGLSGRRSPLSDVLGHVRRMFGAAGSDRRALRRLQDIDDWSDQVEVACYEDRCGPCSP